MNWADWAIVAILVLSSIISLIRGFVKEALSLVIWIAAFVVANIFSHRLEPFFNSVIATPSLRSMAAFALIFVGVLLLGALINHCVGLVLKATGLSGTDRLLGMCFGALRGLLIVMILLIYVPGYLPIKSDPWYQQSRLIPYFLPFQSVVQNTTAGITRWILNKINWSEKTAV
jgi:membrane protein required for colicin V production